MSPAEVVETYRSSLRHGPYWCWLCGRDLACSDGGEAELREAVSTLRPLLGDPVSLRAFSAGFIAGRQQVLA
jgi:hypothetical protein